MKRLMGIIGAGALLFAGAAQVSAASSNDDFGPIPECADAKIASGTYIPATGALTFEVELLGSAHDCVGDIEVAYELWVIKDRPSQAPPDAHSFDIPIGVTSAPELVATAPSSISEDGKFLTYTATVTDDDPTICLFSRHEGTVSTTTTTTSTDEGDHNDNGTTNDDKHKNNDGDNSDGDKHDWDTTTTTTTTSEDFLDRAPNVTDDDGVTDESSCFAVNTAWDSRPGGIGARGYN